jgi:restriction system protein
MSTKISFSIPDGLSGKLTLSSIYHNYTSRGKFSSYGIDMSLRELNLNRTAKSAEPYVLRGKIEEILNSWNLKYLKHQDTLHKENRANNVEELNQKIDKTRVELESLLAATLNVNDAVDWNSIKRKDSFRISPDDLIKVSNNRSYIEFNNHGRPIKFNLKELPVAPTAESVTKEFGIFSRIFRIEAIRIEIESRTRRHNDEISRIKSENIQRKNVFDEVASLFEKLKADFETQKIRDNEALDELRSRYNLSDPMAVEEYCDLVLNSSRYPDFFPKDYAIEYRKDARLLIVDYALPSPDDLPTVESYKYNKSKDEILDKKLSDAAIKKQYDNVIYQICIRTLHELFEADVIDSIGSVAFNGIVTNINPATGNSESKVIMSVSAEKAAFKQINLSNVDPKANFKHFKGISAASLSSLTPIPPVIVMEKYDKRFIEAKAIAGQLDGSVNLASMDWGDFEHLIRELFEQEFASNGGEVKVTRARSDGGVDAIAFDPDPIRGGKIVIQAKRYTNTVGVSAVRDLYGTVMNEGATKGILVTTSDYGSDSYNFAKDKPITLLNGNNLLSLLEKHGHKAKIDLSEAKKFLKA